MSFRQSNISVSDGREIIIFDLTKEMTGVLYDVLPQNDEILILFSDRILHFHGNAAEVEKAIENKIIKIGSAVTISPL